MAEETQQLDTKTQLEDKIKRLEDELDALKTKDGAAAYIASEKETLDKIIDRLPDTKVRPRQISMKTFLSDIKKMIEAKPEKEVARQITRLEGEIVLLEKELKATDWAGGLGVYKESDTTIRVRGGHYAWDGTPKEYEPEAAIDPTDNDTTYVWLKDDNSVGHGIDGDGWPVTDHLPLAEVDVDADGVITAIRDLRGQTFMRVDFA